MKRFRGRKAAKDDLAAPPRPSVESESSSPFKMFSKKKSQEEEPKPELDLATALPSTDDFRTSLLMTNLSARFSMLREQDDPNTKVGKASDDSVLYPKRQSRLMDFGFTTGGLSDIAEVESIRAPFARTSSYQSDDAASTSGSMMSRAKPVEGNNLFGGRQKIYKIAGNGGKPGATAGRALYDDDVSQSSFQKWRQAEREKQLEGLGHKTSSTTSSVPSAARNSTAATSTTSSQPTPSVKEWQSATAAANPTPPMERSVTRTRRLYEQGLTQDLHNQQTSALSRIDTLSRQRNFGARTPDLTPTVPSPASATFSDRFASQRSILNKASSSPMDTQNKFSPFEERTSFGATPPLSPPISETGETQSLSLQFSDRNRPAATGGPNKGSHYDESRYAQRQIQLQGGRETPGNLTRAESNASVPTTRSRSSSTHRGPFEKHDSATFKAKPLVEEEPQTSTFFDDDDDDQPIRVSYSHSDMLPAPPQVTVERPADHEHPAFRTSAVPTPLILEGKLRDKSDSPEDSPTLGPASGGLSGMVRAHLRQDSNASSIYGNAPNEEDLASRFPPERSDIQSFHSTTSKSNPWDSIERGFEMSMDSDLPSPLISKSSMDLHERGNEVAPSAHDSKIDSDQDKEETDDFARHLADGARRVRERLTSYVESDSGSLVPTPPPVSELPPPPRPNALGILKAKPSRGSLVDRARGDRENQSQTKAKKLLGLSAPSSIPSAPRPSSFETNEAQPRKEQSESNETFEDEGRSSMDKENVHAGLKAFRQARRELQRMKELETQARYQSPQGPPPQVPQQLPQQSQERRPPPVTYNRMPSEEARNGSGSRSGSRAPSERDRSGSETSSGGRSGSRPARLRNGSVPREDFHQPMGSPSGPNGMPRQGQMMRSPHLPGPPYSNGNASPGRFNRLGEPSPNLNPPAPYGYDHGQPSPISPMNGGQPLYGPGPKSPRPYHAQQPQHSGKMDQDLSTWRVMRTRDASDPPMVSPAPHDLMAQRDGPRGAQGHQNGNIVAPPLPPINPRRKTNIMADYVRRSDDGPSNGGRMAMGPGNGDESRGTWGQFAPSDDEGPATYRQRLRKATSEANGMNSRARSLRNSPPHPMAPPPLPSSMTGNGLPGGMI
ncbi:hypothetical protein B0J13DRAFT_581781 [Dactylonectria estremocensis]|uniref:Uncharacterized protein n=1 Tax=Dactylonectria estremocensis TaxID=1079267 RepID=A0A9P9JH52_9HYPO|nr:hypothetical protein B0J13DRAFT_581781 [Dactylonectria estremocensis]